MSAIAAFLGRLMLAVLFVLAGIPKIIDPRARRAMLERPTCRAASRCRPGIFEVVAGLLLAIGLHDPAGLDPARRASSLLTMFFFHNQFGDPMQAAMALKNIAHRRRAADGVRLRPHALEL